MVVRMSGRRTPYSPHSAMQRHQWCSMWGNIAALELQSLTASAWMPTAAATPRVVSKEYATKYLAAATHSAVRTCTACD